MDDFIETFDRSVLNSYFEIEQNIFDSNFTDIGALVIALKMLFLGGFKNRGKFLLQESWNRGGIPHTLQDYKLIEHAKCLKRYAAYFTNDFENFIITGIL